MTCSSIFTTVATVGSLLPIKIHRQCLSKCLCKHLMWRRSGLKHDENYNWTTAVFLYFRNKWQNFTNRLRLHRWLPTAAALTQVKSGARATPEGEEEQRRFPSALSNLQHCSTLVFWPLLGKFAKNFKNSQIFPTNRFCDDWPSR